MMFLVSVFKKARSFVALLSGYLLFATLVAIILIALFFDSGALTEDTPLQLLTTVAAMIFLLRMGVAVSNERLETQVKADTAAITQSVQEASTRIETTQRSISEAVRRHSEQVDKMRATVQRAGEVFSLEEALRDLKSRLDGLDPGDSVTLEHLGLDLTNAWDDIVRILEPLAPKLCFNYRLLMLRGEGAGDPPLPIQVCEWGSAAVGQRKIIERKLGQIQRMAKGKGKVEYKIHTYRDLPVVHGFRVHGAHQVAYVTLSRWAGAEEDESDIFDDFSWGGREYHRVLDTSPASERDLLDIFRGYFEHWWRHAEARESKAPAPAAAASPPRREGEGEA